MSVEAMAWAFNEADCSGNDRVVLLVLANHAHPDGTHAFPSHATIAFKARVAERTVRDCLRRLEGADLIVRDGKIGRTIVYRLAMDKTAEVAGTDEPADSRDIPAGSRQDSGSRLPPNRKEQTEEPSDKQGARETSPGFIVAAQIEVAPEQGRPTLRVLGDLALARRVAAQFDAAGLIAECRRYPDRDHLREAERFRDYYEPGGNGENVPIRSLRGRWRTWLSRAQAASSAAARGQSNGRRQRSKGPSSDDLRRHAAELRSQGL